MTVPVEIRLSVTDLLAELALGAMAREVERTRTTEMPVVRRRRCLWRTAWRSDWMHHG